MKIAYFVQDNREQLVLTPETDQEKKMLSLLDGDKDIKIHKGSFYQCQGGWTRYKNSWSDSFGNSNDDESRIIVLDTKETPEKLP